MLGILVSPKSATKGVRDAMGRSRWAMAWVMLDNEGEKGRVKQVLWNRAAANIGLEGVTVTMKYRPRGEGEDGGLDGECVLLWKDQPIERLPPVGGEVGVQ